ncbi:MAG: cupredoxin family copper-binding protein [Acidobacteriota bacterium]
MRFALLVAVVSLIFATGIGPAVDQAKPKTHTVTMEGMRFHPDELTVAPGDTIVWVNEDLVPHTATSQAAGFDSRQIEAGKSWSFKASKKGDFPYVCTLHRKMKATLHVASAAP